MSCKQVRQLLSYRREWTPQEAARAEEHLAGCPACQAVAREYELMDRRLDRLPVPVPATSAPPVLAVAAAAGLRTSAPEPAAPAPQQASRGVLLLVVAALVIVVAIALSATAPRLALRDEPAAPRTGPGVTLPQAAATPLEPGLLPSGADERFTVLLLGIDRRADGGWGYRTDTIVIVSADRDAGSVALVSIPRDLQVAIPGRGDDRINTANVYGYLDGYAGGGPALVKEVIEASFGVAVDAYVMVDFDGFVQVVDAVGGIDVDVPRTLDDPFYPDPRAEDPHAYTTIHFEAGVQHMDGERALQYARSRMTTSDADRMERQQLILLALGEAVRRGSWSADLPELVTGLADAVHTDLALGQIVELAALAEQIDPGSVECHVLRAPLVSGHRRGDGAAVFLPNWEAIDPLFEELFGPLAVLRPAAHTVAVGESVWSIAQDHGLQPETIAWANAEIEPSPGLLAVGQVLTIPPVDGVLYTVQEGDSLEALAERYHTTVAEIVSFAPNRLREKGDLVPGQQLMLPGARKDSDHGHRYPLDAALKAPADAPTGTGLFSWPTEGHLGQGFWSGHRAIDIANLSGTPVVAADTGYVVLAGRDTWGYGNQLLVDHGNGFLTFYAHMNTMYVRAGDVVEKGQQIGAMGATGQATGPHLHFEIWEDGVAQDPLDYLP